MPSPRDSIERGPIEDDRTADLLAQAAARWPRAAYVVGALAVFVVYASIARLSYAYFILPSQHAVFWLPSGLTFALVVRTRNSPQWWPSCWIGLCAAHMFASLLGGQGLPFPVVTAWALANLLLIISITFLARRFVTGPFAFRALRDVL